MTLPARRGFTLMEVLVAIAIIGILAGMLLPALSSARRGAAAKTAKTTIERLKLALESYHSDFGDYPPTMLAAGGNGVNEGAESLLRCLTTRIERGPYLPFEENELGNTDHDKLSGADPVTSTIESKELFELCDPWGNPFIYFHSRDYKGGGKIERYILADGERVGMKPQRSEKTGQYPSLTTYLIWSAGPDGVNENGQGDDVCSWK